MTFEELKIKIDNGDLVFFKNDGSFVNNLLNLFSEGPYYHCGIAFKINDPVLGNDNLFIVEQYPFGRRIVNINTYCGRRFDVIKSPVSWTKYSKELLKETGKSQYSWGNYITIFLHEKFNIKIGTSDSKMVCSDLISEVVLKPNGIKVENRLSPSGLYNDLKEKGFCYNSIRSY